MTGAKSLFLLAGGHTRVSRVAAPCRPSRQRGVPGIKADKHSVLRADVDPATFDRGLKANGGTDREPLLQFAAGWIDLKYLTFESGQKDLIPCCRGWRAKKPAFFFQVARQLDRPSFLPVVRVGADQLISHAGDITSGAIQYARALKGLQREYVVLANVGETCPGIGGSGSAVGKAISSI